MHNIGNGGSNSNTNNRSIVYDGKIAGLYDLEETLGSGHFAVVKLARHVFTGEKVAVKVIDKTKLDEVSRAHLFQEVRCMKLVQHPNVVRLYEVIDTQTKLYLILELGDGGDLYDYIMKHEGGLSENLAREYFRQIVRAISYCHKLHVVHRDLKPENVVFFEKLGVVKLTDFGFSNKFCPGQKLETSCGSLAYSAPEILLGDSYDAPAVDIWSLGVILYMLVCGQPPFEKANDSETLTMIMDCKYTMPSHVSQGCRKLIASMLVRAPEKRATLEQIAKDTWLMEGAAPPSASNTGTTITSVKDQELQMQEGSTQPEYLPLVSRQQVSEDDHTLIIQRMVNGNIATKEEILEALDRNEYNHITATYFLLAERKLRQKRQEQMQKRRPDLSLPVSAQSRLSPRSRIQGIKDKQAALDANNQLLVPASSQISAPRTPGAETHSGGRTRKCSIVQEEEDDEDEIPNCTKHNELLAAPLNRRGSRSEGRINLAVHDKVSNVVPLNNTGETDRSALSNKQIAASNSPQKEIKLHRGSKMVGVASPGRGIENISGIKYVKRTNAENMRMRLGKPRMQHQQIPQIIQTEDIEEETTVKADSVDNKKKSDDVKPKSPQQSYHQFRSSSLDQQNSKPVMDCETKFLVDSSTITIPITTNNQNEVLANAIPKYKTMPSPTRSSILNLGSRALNEIFEEGTDIGSSDTSATTTPRPIIRAHFTGTNRIGTGSSTSTNNPHHHRRTKFNKTRTPSCSSSDASDDDSESRKKRAHKMVGDMSVKPYQVQRRDSHDDSSDSQDPGTTGAAGNNALKTAALIYASNNDSNHKTNSNTGKGGGKVSSSGASGSNHTHDPISCKLISVNNSTTKDIKCQNDHASDEAIGTSSCPNCIKQQQKNDPVSASSYRRHRNGRRRAGETRLRESQSLNRITEVQESEVTNANIMHTSNQDGSNLDLQGSCDTIDGSNSEYRRESIAEADETIVLAGAENEDNSRTGQLSSNKNKKSYNVPLEKTTIEITNKPKSFSARLFHGFIRTKNTNSNVSSQQANSNNNEHHYVDNNKTQSGLIQQQPHVQPNQIIPDPHSADDVDIVLGVIRDSASNSKSSSATKKLKMLGKYFQVHKKICIPALFHRGGGGDSRASSNHKNSSSSSKSSLTPNAAGVDGRLYKAHSCGSIEHNRVNLNPNLEQFHQLEKYKNNLDNGSTSGNCNAIGVDSGGGCNDDDNDDVDGGGGGGTGSCNALPTHRHSVLLNGEKSNKMLANCLGSRFLNNSDSDINQNTGINNRKNCYVTNNGNTNNNNNKNNNNISSNTCNKLKSHSTELQTTKSFLLSISPHFPKFKHDGKHKQKHKQQKQHDDAANDLPNGKQTLSPSITHPIHTNESLTIGVNSHQPPPISSSNPSDTLSSSSSAHNLVDQSCSTISAATTTVNDAATTSNLLINYNSNTTTTTSAATTSAAENSISAAQNQISLISKKFNKTIISSNHSSSGGSRLINSNNSNCISSNCNLNTNNNSFNIKKNNINSNSCNNLSTSTISKISSSNSSPHQINDVPLCSSKC